MGKNSEIDFLARVAKPYRDLSFTCTSYFVIFSLMVITVCIATCLCVVYSRLDDVNDMAGILLHTPVADPGGQPPPPYFKTKTEAQRPENKFLRPGPPLIYGSA